MHMLVQVLFPLAFSVLITFILGATPAVLMSAKKVSGGGIEIEAVMWVPRAEEVAFRFVPAVIHVGAIAIAAIAAASASFGQAHIAHATLWPLAAVIGLCSFFIAKITKDMDDLFIQTYTTSLSISYGLPEVDAPVYKLLAPDWETVPKMLGHSLLCLGQELLDTREGRVLLIVVSSVEAVTIAFAPPTSIENGLALAAGASTVAIIAHAFFMWWISSRSFADAHSRDSLTQLILSHKRYRSRIFLTGLLWGAPYAVTLICSATLIFTAVVYADNDIFMISEGLILGIVGVLTCLLLTSRLHLISNRRALTQRERIDPVVHLEDHVADILNQPDDSHVKGRVACLVEWLFRLRIHLGPSFPLPNNDRLIAAFLLNRLSGPRDEAAAMFNRISRMAFELVKVLHVYEEGRRERGYPKDSGTLRKVKELSRTLHG